MVNHLNQLLNNLERQEAILLGWGTVDVGFTWDELRAAVERYAERVGGINSEELVQALFDRKLVFEFQTLRGEVYRTRMAESMRLLARLRQLFPYHLEPVSRWRTAATLASDYRFAIRRRRYPKRHISLSDVHGYFSKAGIQRTRVQEAVLETLVGEWSLADFQVEATRRLLSDLTETKKSRGIIIGAGTGTGKTHAFYLPAFIKVAESVERDGSPWVRVLALYPRKELLKDQLTTALKNAASVNGRLRTLRPISVGAFYGDTPNKASAESMKYAGWKRQGPGWVCPYFRDPDTGGPLYWMEDDLRRGVECLRGQDGAAYGPEVIRLTRDRLCEEPPDFLFTTTEMLNQYLGSRQYGPLLGIRTDKPPELVLLDEAHTYSGTHGAQVAYLLRRWRYMIRHYRRPHFTGLSATLADASHFFSALTGLPEHDIASIRADDPRWPQDEQGHEYLVALRGDPFSGASLLATTIQTVMLMRRVLDPLVSGDGVRKSKSGGLYGQRVFVFTDDLDVTNRLFDDIADAEGLWRQRGLYVRNPNKEPLAALRSPLRDQEEAERFEDGQSWRLAGEIGHNPSFVDRLTIDRVSSQDAGVAQGTDVVVATSSLEVGYDDDRVGAVIQHKAPRNVASFLQRKGRAGRIQEMRPWTCVVLSDYGRDRLAYQNYDAVFDPEVAPQYLPLGNRYVLRIQAIYVLIEWAADRVLSGRWGQPSRYMDPWRALKRRARNKYERRDQVAFAKVLSELLNDPRGDAANDLAAYLEQALEVSADEVIALMWEPPRAIMTAAVPTLYRRLRSNWKKFVPGVQDDVEPGADHPLPEFIPPALFSDLNLPEVTLILPPIRRGSTNIEQAAESRGVEQALRDFAAGKVNRRFGHADADIRHWVALPNYRGDFVQVPTEEFVEQAEPLGHFTFVNRDGQLQETPVIRPVTLRLTDVPREVQTSSNAQPRWHTQIIVPPLRTLEEGHRQEVSDRISWSVLVKEVRFFTHQGGAPLEMRRFTTGSDATVRVRENNQRSEYTLETEYVHRQGEPIALGFTHHVDAIAFRVSMPAPDHLRCVSRNHPGRLRSLRVDFFKHNLLTADELAEANVFQRDWLQQALLGALVEEVHRGADGLEQAFRSLQKDGLGKAITSVLDRILDASIDPETGEIARGGHGERLVTLCEQDDFVAALASYSPLLWQQLDASFDTWLLERFKTTLAAALLTACGEMTPGRTDEGLLLDLDPDPMRGDEDEELIWISEATLGGNGQVEAILRAYTGDPRRFFQLVEQELQGSDLEVTSNELPRIVQLMNQDDEVGQAFETVRESIGMQDSKKAHNGLRKLLLERGVLCTHGVYAALSHRLLRPGADKGTDQLVAELLERWNRLEIDCGVEVEPRVFSYLAGQMKDLVGLLPHAPQEQVSDPAWRASVYYSLLWSRGGQVRALAFRPYNPFRHFLPTERTLVLDALPHRGAVVKLDGQKWRAELENSLRIHGLAHLEAAPDAVVRLTSALRNIASEPMEDGFLHLYPEVSGVRRTSCGYQATIILPEALQ